jgi:hypothetical protein
MELEIRTPKTLRKVKVPWAIVTEGKTAILHFTDHIINYKLSFTEAETNLLLKEIAGIMAKQTGNSFYPGDEAT